MPDYSRLPMSTDPLSADVFVIKGKRRTYIIDCGSCDAAVDYINAIEGPKVLVLTHFHQDHTGNMQRLESGMFESILCGKKTYERIRCGSVVNEAVEYSEDGVRIIPITNCHAKGSLALELGGRYLFVGDALCGCDTPEGYGYNAGMLLSTIREIEKESVPFIVPSHTGEPEDRDAVLARLREIYSKRKGNNPYIII